MKCPSCGVEIPPFRIKCACGYHFVKGEKEQEKPALFDYDSTKEKSWYQDLWPELIDLKTAEEASKQGVWAAGVLVVMNSVGILGSLLTGDTLQTLENTWDVVWFALVAWGIHRKSRVVAVCALSFYLLESALFIAERDFVAFDIIVLIIRILLVIVFANSVRGTIAYHKYLDKLT